MQRSKRQSQGVDDLLFHTSKDISEKVYTLQSEEVGRNDWFLSKNFRVSLYSNQTPMAGPCQPTQACGTWPAALFYCCVGSELRLAPELWAPPPPQKVLEPGLQPKPRSLHGDETTPQPEPHEPKSDGTSQLWVSYCCVDMPLVFNL